MDIVTTQTSSAREFHRVCEDCREPFITRCASSRRCPDCQSDHRRIAAAENNRHRDRRSKTGRYSPVTFIGAMPTVTDRETRELLWDMRGRWFPKCDFMRDLRAANIWPVGAIVENQGIRYQITNEGLEKL